MDRTGNDIIVMMLKQMGAVSVKTTPAKITIAKFVITEEFKLTYVFEARKGEGTFLSRVSPYPMLLGQFFGEQDVIDYIARDIERFQKVIESDKFEKYLELQKDLGEFNRQMEQLFLSRPTPDSALKEIDRATQELHKTLRNMAKIAPVSIPQIDLGNDSKEETK